MNLQKEDIDNIDRILEMYVQDEISRFEAVEISNTLSIEYGYARFLIAEIRALNDDRSFLRFDNTVRSGNLHPLNNDKYLIRRFVEKGGYKQYLEEKNSFTDMEDLSQKIDLLLSGQNMLLKGQAELDEFTEQRILELKELLISIATSKEPWTEKLQAHVVSAIVGIGISSDNAVSLLESIGKSIEI